MRPRTLDEVVGQDHLLAPGSPLRRLVEGDQAVLDKLNWFLRDWRRNEPTHMDPSLFDVVWQVYRESGSQQPIMVMSAYRSPETNAMLRRRSRG